MESIFNKLNDYFKDNIRISLIFKQIFKENLIIITKEDLFYCIDINDENILSLIINDNNSVIESMIIKDLCYKQINDLYINLCGFFSEYCFARSEYNIYYYNIDRRVMKEYISEEKIIDICCGYKHLILLSQSGKVYEYLVKENERENAEKYIYFKMKSFTNEKILMISCGKDHSLTLTESGRVFGWGSNSNGQLGVDARHSIDPIIIELNMKIQKISCGKNHSLLLSCDGHIYAFGYNFWGEVGNGTRIKQKFPIKLELNKKFIDIVSHPDEFISMSRSIDGTYYVWGHFEGKAVLSPQSTKYESFEDILIQNSNNMDIFSIKTFGKLIEFKESFVKNGFYLRNFEQIKLLGSGSFGTVFEVEKREDAKYDFSGKSFEYFESITEELLDDSTSKKHKAIKRMDFDLEKKSEIIKEYLNFSVISRDLYFKNEYLVKHYDAWFEESNDKNDPKISLYIEMELCDKTLKDIIDEFNREKYLKTNETLTTVGYYIASQIFIQILKGVNYLHTQNEPLIHRDLKPANILLTKCDRKGFCVKIADFGLTTIHKFSEQSHTMLTGTPRFMAPEVFNNKKYDTKADIYSLGVIFQIFFDLKMIE
jgi:hypothetical protein